MSINSLTGWVPAIVFVILTVSCDPGSTVEESDATVATTLPRSTPEDEGINSGAIMEMLDEIEQRGINFHSLMVVRNDKVVAEGWWSPYQPEYKHTLYSLSKSFTSTAIGFAVQEGLLTVNDKVTKFFPDDLPATVDENLAAMEVRHLLTMSSGHTEPTMPGMFGAEDGNWPGSFLNQPLDTIPGRQFFYNTGATYMLSAIIQKLTNQKLIDYLTPRLFEPLGIEGADWEEDPKGINVGGYGLRVRTEDIAKLGLLYLHEGVYNGDRLLSEEWVKEATSFQIPNGEGDHDWAQGYGYQFWRCQPDQVYRGDGAFGQYSIVMPTQNTVVAITSEVEDMQEVMTLVWDILLPAISQEPLEANAVQLEKLNTRLDGLTLSTDQLQPLKKDGLISQSFLLEENSLGFESLTFNPIGEGGRLQIVAGDTTTMMLGSSEWKMNPAALYAGAPAVPSMAVGRFGMRGDTLIFQRRFIETVHGDEIALYQEGDHVSIQLTKSTSIWGPSEFSMSGKVIN